MSLYKQQLCMVVDILIVAYDSRTGNVKRFVSKLDMDSIQITEDSVINEPFVLITFTTGFGQVPPKTAKFLERNHRNLIAVSASGNKNWGDSFAKSADIISESFGVPVILKFELSGTPNDVVFFKERVQEIGKQTHRTK